MFDQDEGLRHQVFLTGTPYPDGGSAQFLEDRHRGHACVEDHIRCGRTTGFGRLRDFNVNAAWLELSLAAIDLPAWMRVPLPDGGLAAAVPKNSPRLSTASPHCPVPLADRQTPARPRPERPWRTRPPRWDSAMTKQ